MASDSDVPAPAPAPATLPPGELELARVSEFERTIARSSENDARLARLLELLSWSADDGE